MQFVKSILQRFRQKRQDREQWALTELKARYHGFRIFLENNGKALELIVSLDGQLHRAEPADIRATVDDLLGVSSELVDGLNLLADDRYEALYSLHGRLGEKIHGELRSLGQMALARKACIGLDQLEPTALLQAGAKAVNLSRLRQMGLPVPNGFVCTVRACKNFLHSGQLAEQIRPLLRDVEIGRLQTEEAAARIRELILSTPLPPEVTTALFQAYEELAAQERADGQEVGQPLAVSVRSSGAAEDGVEHSFAGQFTSLLNVRGQEPLLDACRRVIASGFSARAIAYRINAGLAPFDFELAVLVQVMVPAETAGVLFTVDPSHPESGRMLISAVPGLGTTAVGGEVPADIYRPLRSLGEQGDTVAVQGQQLVEQHIVRKTYKEVPEASGGLRKVRVSDEEAEQPLLDETLLAQLVAVGRTIESMEGMAQDVEWACTRGNLRILQARPLRLSAASGQRLQVPTLSEPLCTGFCASAGKAVGRVRLIHSIFELHQLESELAQILSQAPLILALPHSIVDAARFLPHCAGVLVDMGNPTDHLACVARECGVPMMTGVQSSLVDLAQQQWLLVDADHGLVLEAPDSVREQALHSHQQRLEDKKSNRGNSSSASATVNLSPVRQSLRNRIVALNLTDAYGPTFSLAECRSIHDIIRYTHEMAVLTMFSAGDQVIEDAGGLLRPMEIGVPFSFLVIDLGGGIRRRNPKHRRRLALRRTLTREDVLSVPLAALCDGMTTPGLRWYAPSDIDALPEVFSRTMLDNRGARPVGAFNYALSARDYLNLNARVEFHFVMVDAVCGRDSHANYIRFRFKGGGAGLERSRRRAIFFQHVLEHNGFYTTVVGDLVTASLTGADKERIKGQLVMIGRLFGFSRFLDGMMSNDTIPTYLAKAFLGGQFDSLAALTAMEASQALEADQA
ncbi:MAG: PEP/pyruvate-binding domain-containing protein [Desulfobulbus sp.]|nr:PEP/pyruvate-binding domain-containing protein [Desulfobulbus sp.]